MAIDRPMWEPTAASREASNMAVFMRYATQKTTHRINDWQSLYHWSITQSGEFWQTLWDFCDVRAMQPAREPLESPDQMPGARWFPGAQLNFAENLLRRRDDSEAILFIAEGQVERRLSYRQLYDAVSRLQQALRSAGVEPGDRVAGYLPNMPEAVIAMLASASLGAVWTSCSPDFGVQGVIDRFGQIEPKLLFTVDAYYYNGKQHRLQERIQAIHEQLPSLEDVIVTSLDGSHAETVPGQTAWSDLVSPYSAGDIIFTPLDFDHPLYILYSSGTTGVPKCIVHGAGGTLLQHLKEHRLHANLMEGDRLFYFTTCGWMMWNWLVSGLASGASLVLYDGSPFYPSAAVLFELADKEAITHFGVSAKYIDAVNKSGYRPAEHASFDALRMVLSTGSPLSPEGFDFVYTHIKADQQLASISGGTDIVSCFMLGNPLLPVWRGELQSAGLGMAVDVFDSNGQSLEAHKGELVCKKPFPSMPVGFWNDLENKRFHAAYFERFPGVWHHGDYVEKTRHGGYIIFGRSDATLNPGGVRIGTAEIYRQVEKSEAVAESVVIGQRIDDDERIVLFVRLQPGRMLDDTLRDEIRQRIRQNTTPRHVPSVILQVDDIPRTKSGKIVELAVRKVVHGESVDNLEALANPEALDYFRNRTALSS